MKKELSLMSRWISAAEEQNKTLAEVILEHEIEHTDVSEEKIRERMESQLKVMERSVEQGLAGVKSRAGLSGMDAKRYDEYRKTHETLTGPLISEVMAYAIAVNEVNAAMGVICATPTAGSSGVVPAVLFAVRERLNLTIDRQIDFLLVAGGVGMMLANNASISGAGGGCQAEIGSAAAMAACALAEAAGGTPTVAGHAAALTLKALLGLTCDPVAGLVEVPCIKRNASAAVVAIVAADLALSGVESKIPVDEVIDAMGSIGRMMPIALRETALGGLAQTPTGRKIEAELRGNDSGA